MGKILEALNNFNVAVSTLSGFKDGADGKMPDSFRFFQDSEVGEAYRKSYEKGQKVSLKASLAGGLKKVNKALGD